MGAKPRSRQVVFVRPGSLLQDRYQVNRVLGRSVDGSVFLCEDLRIDGKWWAVKQTVSAGDFDQQALYLATLHHPALPLIADHFQEDGHAYLVVDYIDGVELGLRVISQGPVGVSQAFAWGLEIADVLSLLASQSTPLMLRNLSPREILILADDTIRLVNLNVSALERKPRPGWQQGASGFAAPEAWSGEADERADLFSLGAILYFSLTGYAPDYQQPECPDGLDERRWAVLQSCLAHDPGQRGTAEQLRQALSMLG